MYTEHFGLNKSVFDGGIAQGDDLFLGARQQRIAANLKIGLTTRDSVVTLTGCIGVGKTTIAAEALRITATRLAQTWVGNMSLDPDEILELLLAGFELNPFGMGRVQRLHTWRQFMSELSVTDTRICILVENAVALGPKVLQALEALTAADPNDCPGANLVLMGPPSLQQVLQTPGLQPLQLRIRARQRLDPMSADEVDQYLRHRITAVGGDYDAMVAPGAAAMVHRFSAGVPRIIKNVCETALTVEATRKSPQLTPEVVRRVAETVYGLAPSVPLPAATQAKAPAPAAAPAAGKPAAARPAAAPAEPAPVAKAQALVDKPTPKPPQPQPTAAAAPSAPEPPVLTDEIDFDLPSDDDNGADEVQPAAATPAAAVAPPAPAAETDTGYFEQLTGETHLHEISDSMAERLFAEFPEPEPASRPAAAAPLDSSDLELSPAETAEVLQLDEDLMAGLEEALAEPDDESPPKSQTMVF